MNIYFRRIDGGMWLERGYWVLVTYSLHFQHFKLVDDKNRLTFLYFKKKKQKYTGR